MIGLCGEALSFLPVELPFRSFGSGSWRSGAAFRWPAGRIHLAQARRAPARGEAREAHRKGKRGSVEQVLDVELGPQLLKAGDADRQQQNGYEGPWNVDAPGREGCRAEQGADEG